MLELGKGCRIFFPASFHWIFKQTCFLSVGSSHCCHFSLLKDFFLLRSYWLNCGKEELRYVTEYSHFKGTGWTFLGSDSWNVAVVRKYKHVVQLICTTVAAKAWDFALCVLILHFFSWQEGDLQHVLPGHEPGGASAPSAAVSSCLCIHTPCYRNRVKRLVLSTQRPHGLGGVLCTLSRLPPEWGPWSKLTFGEHCLTCA